MKLLRSTKQMELRLRSVNEIVDLKLFVEVASQYHWLFWSHQLFYKIVRQHEKFGLKLKIDL